MLIARLRCSACGSGGDGVRGAAEHDGERRRHEETAKGSTVCYGVFTKTTSTRSRAEQGLPGAAATACDDPRRATAAAGLRRAWHGDVGHMHAFQGHRRHPYLAAEMRRRQHDDGRRRRLGSTAAA
jgi:hypothetical protein